MVYRGGERKYVRNAVRHGLKRDGADDVPGLMLKKRERLGAGDYDCEMTGGAARNSRLQKQDFWKGENKRGRHARPAATARRDFYFNLKFLVTSPPLWQSNLGKHEAKGFCVAFVNFFTVR